MKNKDTQKYSRDLYCTQILQTWYWDYLNKDRIFSLVSLKINVLRKKIFLLNLFYFFSTKPNTQISCYIQNIKYDPRHDQYLLKFTK